MAAPFLMVDGAGTPQPPEELNRRLAAVDPLLFVQYWAASWRVFRTWSPNDPRWARVRSQEIPPETARDIVAQIPAHVPVDEMAPYLERELRGCSVEDARKLADSLAQWNTFDAGKDAVDATIADVVEGTIQTLETPRTKGKRVKHTVPKP